MLAQRDLTVVPFRISDRMTAVEVERKSMTVSPLVYSVRASILLQKGFFAFHVTYVLQDQGAIPFVSYRPLSIRGIPTAFF
jgi:hypothetical protein